MEIKLKRLELRDFKKIKKFSFEPNGRDATVLGANKAGKTTLADAFNWLLFGKDTLGRADFGIKGNDESGQAIPNLDHIVKAVIEIDGKPLDLQKTYREKWTKKRGSAKRTLTSHTTEHSIDGVPIQKKEWDSRMGALINEDIFKLLTLPSFFSSMPWQRCRATLLEVCGDIPDRDVIASDEALSALPDILGDRSLEDQRKVIAGKKKRVNDRLKEIPARIDELSRSLPEEMAPRKTIEAYIRNLDSKIQAAKDDTVLPGLRKELAEAQTKLAETQAKYAKGVREANKGIDKKVEGIDKEIKKLQKQAKDLEWDNNQAVTVIGRNKETVAGLGATYATVRARKQVYDEICPTCNQPIPSDQIEAARKQFNENQAIELGSIQADGKKLKAGNEILQKTIKEDEGKIKSLAIEVTAYEKSIKEEEEDRVEAKPSIEIAHLKEQVAHIEDEIKEHRIEKDLQKTLHILETDRQAEQAKLAKHDAALSTKKRIKELEIEEKNLAGEYEELEMQIFLMEKFIVSKVNLLEDQVNSKFELVKWKLFDIQVNEGVKECCIPMLNGSTDLSNSERINVGLDGIRTFSKHYNIYVPTWLDNAESNTHPLEIPSQTFKLVVSEDYPEMEVSYG